MLAPKLVFDTLKGHDVDFFTGVPDSLLKDFCAFISDNAAADDHVIAANEGNAIALAAGHYLASGNPALVYMQNSGLGNSVNPLLSLADPEVYSIPMLLLIGWRGEPGKKDEPQHIKQGKVTIDLLNAVGIPYSILPSLPAEAVSSIERGIAATKKNKAPFALVVPAGVFEKYKATSQQAACPYQISREEAIQTIVNTLGEKDIVVCTTGKASRELFEYREKKNAGFHRDFLTVGSMGHASHIALGIALTKKNRTVYCLDGDGAALMHLGGLAIIGCRKPPHFKHILLNNGSHESVGAQPTVGYQTDFIAIARACGYSSAVSVKTTPELIAALAGQKLLTGPVFLEVRISASSRKDLRRPSRSPLQNKQDFMEFLK